jgi:hypothetical protein
MSQTPETPFLKSFSQNSEYALKILYGEIPFGYCGAYDTDIHSLIERNMWTESSSTTILWTTIPFLKRFAEESV